MLFQLSIYILYIKFEATFILEASLCLVKNLVMNLGVLILLLELWRMCKDDHNPQVGS